MIFESSWAKALFPGLKKHLEDYHAGYFHYDEDGNKIDHYNDPRPPHPEYENLFYERKES
jgi:hypothetical protein